MLFLGRSEEQACFGAVLADLAGGGQPDEGYVMLVHGLGSIGKSTLLRRYRQIAADGLPAGRGQRAELRAIARMLAGDPAGASAELNSAASTRLAGDLFRQPLYDLLRDPPIPGLTQLLDVWKAAHKDS